MKYNCEKCGLYIGKIENENTYDFTGRKVFVKNGKATIKCKCNHTTEIILKFKKCM